MRASGLIRGAVRRRVGIALGLSLLLGGCAAPGIAGTYDCPHQSVVVIREDGTFSMIGHDAAFEGTYEVDDDTIAFSVEGLDTTRAVINDDGSIVFLQHDHRDGSGDAPRLERCVRR